MPRYLVTRKADGVEVYRYDHTEPVEWNGMEFETHDHTELVVATEDGAVETHAGGVVMTKREFIKRFTVEEYAAIKAAAAQNAALDYYWQMFMLAEEIDSGNSDTIAGVTMLEQAGLIGEGRAQEILNG